MTSSSIVLTIFKSVSSLTKYLLIEFGAISITLRYIRGLKLASIILTEIKTHILFEGKRFFWVSFAWRPWGISSTDGFLLPFETRSLVIFEVACWYKRSLLRVWSFARFYGRWCVWKTPSGLFFLLLPWNCWFRRTFFAR